MSFFFGRGGQKVKPQFTGLQTQTSTGAVPIPLCYGENRLAPNLIWQGDFKSHKQTQKAGKGGGGKSVSYTYSASFQLGICWGPITSITRTWKDQEKKNSYTDYGFSLQLGTNPQSPWGYMSSSHPSEALGYPDIAVLSVANYDLGQTNSFGQHSFQVQALLYGTGVGGAGADPALIIQDFLEDPTHGMGMSLSIFSNLLSTGDAPTTGDSAYQTYCRAMGFALSPFLASQESAKDILSRWLLLTNTAPVSTGYTIKFHPYGPDELTANGVTYLPDFPVRYELTDRDFLDERGADPIVFNRVDPADAPNKFSMVIANKENEFNDLPVPWKDQGLIDQYGERKDQNLDAKEVTDPELAAIMAALIGQRKAYIRNSFEFKLPIKYCRLEPMDIVGCTDPRFGHFYVLLKEVTEDEDNALDIVAEEYTGSVSSTPSNNTQTGSNNPVNTAVDPGPVNPPIIFEPPSLLSGTAQVWAAVSGGDGVNDNPNWGGCYVWISTDNVTYNNIGQIDTPARMGKLSALLATYGGTNPDATHTLSVDLSMSAGELSDAASPSDAAAGVTASYVDGEILSYEDAVLSSADHFNCTGLYRALYGTTVGAHAVGTAFARLDDAIFKFDLTQDYIGKTLYLKFQSYNIFGGGLEDLSTCVAYTFSPGGVGFGTGAGGLPSTPTGVSGSAGAGFTKLTWTANPANDNVLRYEIWRATGSSQPFGSASKIDSTTGTEFSDSSGAWATAYTYFVVAVNSVGSSGPSTGVNLTPTQPTVTFPAQPYGWAFTKTPVASKILSPFDSPIAWEVVTADITNWQGTIVNNDTATATAPTAQTDFDIQSPPGTSIGTMRFAASSLTATFIMAADHSFPLGQIVQIVSPSSLNGIVGAITGSIRGKRS
jgi:hypothetical protein